MALGGKNGMCMRSNNSITKFATATCSQAIQATNLMCRGRSSKVCLKPVLKRCDLQKQTHPVWLPKFSMESAVRSLPQRHLAKVVFGKYDPPPLGPDEMQLYSYYRPGLIAGDYTIEAKQEISATSGTGGKVKTQKLTVTNVRNNDAQKPELQAFEVVVPRFNLDREIINSYYPPDGHQDEGRILPHIVFNDKHFPWEIDAGVTDRMNGTIDNSRNLVPWVALLVFDPEELHIDTFEEMTALKIPNVKDINSQNLNGTFAMQVKEYFGTVPAAARINFEGALKTTSSKFKGLQESNDSTQVIFPKKALFYKMFQNLESMKYLAHVRNINTVGFPDAGVEEFGLYSIVVSSRTGRFDITTPRTQICHLVSMEHVDSTLKSWPNGVDVKDTSRIGMFSLFSWVYTALPPDPVNFVDTVENLILNQQMLRTNDNVLKSLKNSFGDSSLDTIDREASQLLYDRLSKGYVPARWRTETGEETAAINRGPLVPLPVPSAPTSDLPDCSNTSKEYQIFDRKLGLMDLSYSSAWQLGKTLAISDTAFSAALMRFRSTLTNTSANLTRKDLNDLTSEGSLVKNIKQSLANLGKISQGTTGDPQRLNQPLVANPIVDVKSDNAISKYKGHLNEGTLLLASAGDEIYNEFNKAPPNDNDWVLVHNWLMDKLFLADIPPHQLFPDPSFVPSEALRYFYVDDFWLDCLIDGALSVANHLDRDDDMIRVQIKEKFNKYLDTNVGTSNIKPQIPGYGFVLRSKLVKTMPDLRITVTWNPPDPENAKRQSICRYTRYDDTTIICLLDRTPEELDSIVLMQPPHQQRFSLGNKLTATELEFQVRHLYTDKSKLPVDEKGVLTDWPRNSKQPNADKTKTWYDWETRCMKLNVMATDINALLQDPTNHTYEDKTPNSCEVALELNDPSYYFKIIPPTKAPPTKVIPRNRKLYVNKEADLAKAGPQQPKLTPGGTKPSTGDKPAAVPPPPVPPTAPPILQPLESNRIKPPNTQTRILPLPKRLLDNRKHNPAPLNISSHFDLRVYPDYASYPSAPESSGYDSEAYIPTLNDYLFDLVFSIRKKPEFAISKFELLEIQVDISTGTGLAKDIKENAHPLLMPNYDGPGVNMANNQRFIPFLYTAEDHLTVRLIPRLAEDGKSIILNDRKTEDLSFVFAEANVAALTKSTANPTPIIFKDKLKSDKRTVESRLRGVTKVTMIETFMTSAGPYPVETNLRVVKNPVQDEFDKLLSGTI